MDDYDKLRHSQAIKLLPGIFHASSIPWVIDGIKPLPFFCGEKHIVDNEKEIISTNIYPNFVLYLKDQCFFNSLFILFSFICFVVVKDMLHLGITFGAQFY